MLRDGANRNGCNGSGRRAPAGCAGARPRRRCPPVQRDEGGQRQHRAARGRLPRAAPYHLPSARSCHARRRASPEAMRGMRSADRGGAPGCAPRQMPIKVSGISRATGLSTNGLISSVSTLPKGLRWRAPRTRRATTVRRRDGSEQDWRSEGEGQGGGGPAAAATSLRGRGCCIPDFSAVGFLRRLSCKRWSLAIWSLAI